MQFLKKHFLFVFYLIFSFGIALIAHRELLFNLFNYGRHWDWTFFSFIPMYERYIHNFYYVINNNGAGTYGAIGFSDYLVKLIIIIIGTLLPSAPVPLINKTFVFVVLPVIASIGVWSLTQSIARRSDQVTTHERLLAFFGNLFYTFSLPFMYELHGGALNRMVSIALLPYVFALLFRSITTARSYPYLIAIALISTLLDVTNIFYISVCVLLFIMIAERPLFKKIYEFTVYGVSLALVNAYWLYAIVISKTINPVELSAQRKTPIDVLQNYSVPFKQLILATSTPHNLIEIAYQHYWIRYLPSIMVYLITLYAVWYVAKHKQRTAPKLTLVAIATYIITTVITSGTYSIGNIYFGLYQIPFLGFIQNSVRFTTNSILSLYILFIVLLTQSRLSAHTYLQVIIGCCSLLWVGFLVVNPGLVRQTYEQSIRHTLPGTRPVNNEIGSLYHPDSELLERLEHDYYLGNILPVPSAISPYFEHNVYPTTSQGSHTEVEFDKNMIQTSGGSSIYETYFRSLIKQKRYIELLQRFSVQYIWQTGNSIYTEPEHDFDHLNNTMLAALLKKLGINNRTVASRRSQTQLITIPLQFLLPIITIQNGIDTTSVHLEMRKVNETKYIGIIHNAPSEFTLVLTRLFYPGWKLEFFDAPQSAVIPKSLLTAYRVIPHSEQTQATKEELEVLIKKGFITSIGDGKVQWLHYHTYDNGIQRTIRSMPVMVGYISKSIHGTIQNENLPDFTTTSLHNKHTPATDHARINGYMNGWNVHRSDVCSQVRCRKSGTQLAFALSFEPQEAYQVMVLFSAGSMVALLTLVIILFRRASHEN